MHHYPREITDCCFGVCGMIDRFNRSEIGWCWDCVDRLLWGYRVSCLVTIVIKVCRTMDGAALADDRSGVTFTAELCIPWDAPEAVIDIDSGWHGIFPRQSRTVRSV